MEEAPLFKGGWRSSILVVSWPSCTLKTKKQKTKNKKGHCLLVIVALHQQYLLFDNYTHSLLHCSSEEYCDCSIRVSRIIYARLSMTATDNFRETKPPIIFFTGATTPFSTAPACVQLIIMTFTPHRSYCSFDHESFK